MKKTLTALYLFPVCLLMAAAPSAQASGVGTAIGRAVINKVIGGHNLDFNTPWNSANQLVIIPEPNTWALLALGGLMGLAAWRLRRRSTSNKISSPRA